jgi:hypothetical protein
MSRMKDVISDVCELYSKGYKPYTIAALLHIPLNVVEDAIAVYQREYDEVFA